MNPCPCGYYGDPVQECTCSNAMVSRYQKRISGPLLDRADLRSDNIHIEVSRVEAGSASRTRGCRATSWASRRRRPVGRRGWRRRERGPAELDSRWSQGGRSEGTRLLTNADTPALAPPTEGSASVKQRPEGTRRSTRACHRTRSVKPARTIADPPKALRPRRVWPAAPRSRRRIWPSRFSSAAIQCRPRRQS
jgi:magnesium chelatase family protein